MSAVSVTMTRHFHPTRRTLARWALLAVFGAGMAAGLLHGPVAHAEPVLRCTVTTDQAGNVYLDDCDAYTDAEIDQ